METKRLNFDSNLKLRMKIQGLVSYNMECESGKLLNSGSAYSTLPEENFHGQPTSNG